MKKGYFGIGIENTKTEQNIGTLWRSAFLLGASYIFTIGRRYKKQASDTPNTWKHIPLFNYDTFDEFYNALPYDAPLTGVELNGNAIQIKDFTHPERCVYLLGAEDNGLTKKAIDKCHSLIQLPGIHSMNVSVAGSIVMYDRFLKS